MDSLRRLFEFAGSYRGVGHGRPLYKPGGGLAYGTIESQAEVVADAPSCKVHMYSCVAPSQTSWMAGKMRVERPETWTGV